MFFLCSPIPANGGAWSEIQKKSDTHMRLYTAALVLHLAPPRMPPISMCSGDELRRVQQLQTDANVPDLKRLQRLETELAEAVSSEQYELAASLRDELAGMRMGDELAVLSANANFYRAFSEGDIELMGKLWLDHPEVVCIHPGHRPLHGYEDVMASWKTIFSDSGFTISPSNVRCRVLDGMARVSCMEAVGDSNRLVATNVFEQHDGRWWMVLHQASPVMISSDEQGEE